MNRRPRVRAPELRGRGWLNTGGRDLQLADFRGRWLLLDFWTFCCINCLHVLDELRPLEKKYDGELVVALLLRVDGNFDPEFGIVRDEVGLGNGEVAQTVAGIRRSSQSTASPEEVIGSSDGRLYVLDAATGTLEWLQPLATVPRAIDSTASGRSGMQMRNSP